MSVRVLIVDDSSFVREVLREVLTQQPDIEVVGEASDGKRAESLVQELRPDVVTMDVVMPMLSGLDAIRRIMSRCPTPIIVVSDADSATRELAMQALAAGAIDTFAKPRTGFDQRSAEQLIALVRSAANARGKVARSAARMPPPSLRAAQQRVAKAGCIGIVASTGGPQTLQRVLAKLPPKPSVPIAIVQHTSVGFTRALASWLTAALPVPVTLARDRQRVAPGQILLAPDDTHLEFEAGGTTRLHHGARLGNHRPSGTLLLKSLARAYRASAVGIVLTGMGDDGADGAQALEIAGGLVLVEEPRTAILEGMPRAAVQHTQRSLVASADRLGELLGAALGSRDA